MKTLTDHVIVYDDECPMCDLYTGAFVKTKMLDAKGREAYSWLPASLARHVDKQRARNEIALINTKNGNVLYGIDSLFTVIGHRFPLLKPLFSFAPFRMLMKIIYSFISYNRRVIVPTSRFEGQNSCTPDLHFGYRVAYIALTWIITSFILNAYSRLVVPYVPASHLQREFLICGGQIVFQSCTILWLQKDRLIHYLGNMMTISFAGGLLLLPALLMASLGAVTEPLLYLGWFGVVVGLMLLEHYRRVKYLGISSWATVSWILYRLIVLAIIFSF